MNFIADLLGATPEQDPELYSVLSPLERAGHPPLPADAVAARHGRHLRYGAVGAAPAPGPAQAAGVPAVLVEFPRADHAFDLVLPQVSPAAQAALCDVELFLDIMLLR